jgi:hypothetical protein
MCLVLQVFVDDVNINYEDGNDIKRMRKKFLGYKKEGFYFLGDLINSNIIAFADINGDKLTDIISYKETESKIFTFYVHEYSENDGDPKFLPEKELFTLNLNGTNATGVRNLHVGSFYETQDKYSFLVSFNTSKENELLHYIYSEDLGKQIELHIKSNILIMNKDYNQNGRILYFDNDNNKRKICKLILENNDIKCQDKDFSEYLIDGSNKNYVDKNISLKGGIAYVDLSGNCVPDIVLSHEEGSTRIIEVYTSKRQISKDKGEDFFNLTDTIILDNKDNYGAFAITNINDEKSEDFAPSLDLLIPLVNENKVIVLKNKKNNGYKWSNTYCDDDYNDDSVSLFNSDITQAEYRNLSIDGVDNSRIKLDSNYATIIRVGDFLGTSNPGILVKQNVYDESNNYNYSQISLFQRIDGNFKYYTGIKLEDNAKTNINGDSIKMGLFFDIDEEGILSLIISTNKNKTYFFFNFKSSIYFIKSKLMNDKKKFYDVNLGSTYRYIVTNKAGDRHMDVSFQMAQTSDMNIPLPYSFAGLDDTNNYVEYFGTISGNYLPKATFVDSTSKNWKQNTPIIPNTQMMISKYYNDKGDVEWNVDLIVQPMEEIWLFLLLVIIVLLIVLGIIIYLHVKELKEEQKETTKFKSWFA